MKSTVILSLVFVAFGAQAETATAGTTPTQVCSQLVEAAKGDNYEMVQNLTMTHGKKKADKGMKAHKAKFEKMQKTYMAKLKEMTCGTEQVAGDHAVVTATAGEEKRLIPFVQAEGQWKFDMHTYRSFYHMDEHGKGGKPHGHKSM